MAESNLNTKRSRLSHELVLLATILCRIQAWSPPAPALRQVAVSLTSTSGPHEGSANSNSIPRAGLSRRQFSGSLFQGSLAILLPSAQADATVNDPKSGIALPEEGEIERSIPSDWIGVDDPFDGVSSGQRFGRLDSTPDSMFYADPRFVEHVDEQAVKSMTSYISQVAIPRGDDRTIRVLDLCSSWTSHIDLGGTANKPPRISGLGMNARELERNSVLSDWVVRDLNENPTLPYENASFDVVLCQLSIDYLTRPKEVLKEVGRVLRPGGSVHILFSNRLFLTKAVALWTGADDIDHAYTVGCYLHFCNGGFKNIQAIDLSTRKGRDRRIVGDPLYVVTASK